jgi:hypothetical protein
MELNMRVIMSLERNKAMANSIGQMVVPIKEHSLITTFKVKVSTSGLMADNTMVIGSIIRCMAPVSLLGTMGENTKETTMMTRNKVKVLSTGQMAENTSEDGTMESNMVLVSIWHPKEKLKMENGKMVKELDG